MLVFVLSVARSLASCQGALLLVDSTQSVQAQTLANHAKAKTLGKWPTMWLTDWPDGLVAEYTILCVLFYSTIEKSLEHELMCYLSIRRQFAFFEYYICILFYSKP